MGMLFTNRVFEDLVLGEFFSTKAWHMRLSFLSLSE
jgi:hypothetical protein